MRASTFSKAIDVATRRDIAERTERRRARRLSLAYQKTMRNRRKAAHTAILGAMHQFRAYTWDQLRAASSLSEKVFASAMATLTRRQLIEKTPEGAGFVYSLPC